MNILTWTAKTVFKAGANLVVGFLLMATGAACYKLGLRDAEEAEKEAEAE